MGYQPPSGAHNEGIHLIKSKEQLVDYFKAGYKKPEEVRIGMEVEKHGIHLENYAPVKYLENNGMKKIQEKLITDLNWKTERQEGKYITAMKRGGSLLTLEYLESVSELSGRTNPSIHDLARELRLYQHELSEISKLFNVVWLGIGYDPFHSPKELRRLPINRFDIIQRHYKLHTQTVPEADLITSVQANIDYISEDDARRKFQLLLRLSPFLRAMYAHSPLKEGKNTGFVSYRTFLMTESNQNSGIKELFFDPDFDFTMWTEFCFNTPMVAIVRDGKWQRTKMTFKNFMKSGWQGYAAAMEDWILHLSFIHTDVRIKGYIELRPCDSLPPSLIPSMQAIVKSFVYHPEGERFIKNLTKDWKYRDFLKIQKETAKHGLAAEIHGKKLLGMCKEILKVATDNLRALPLLNEKGQDESIFLEPIKELVLVKEKSPGEWLRDRWDNEWRKNPQRLIEWCSF